jgi:hypothetical protein
MQLQRCSCRPLCIPPLLGSEVLLEPDGGLVGEVDSIGPAPSAMHFIFYRLCRPGGSDAEGSRQPEVLADCSGSVPLPVSLNAVLLLWS